MTNTRIALAGVLSLFLGAQVMAAPYQFEVTGLYTDGDFKQGNQELGFDGLAIRGTYFLKPVDESSGPLALHAFLDTASSLSLGYAQSEVDNTDNDTDVIDAEARLVTATDLIGILELTNTDNGPDDNTDYVIGAGKYLDNSSEVILTLGIEDDALDTRILSGSYHRLLDRGANTYLDYTASLNYIDNDRDDGFGVSLDATYFPSEILGLSGGIEHEDLGDNSTTDFSIGAEYFVNEGFAVSLGYLKGEVNELVDFENFILSATGRF